MCPVASFHQSVSTWRQPIPETSSERRSQLIATLARRVALLGEGRLCVAVDGRTAAGKTMFAHELGVALTSLGRPVLRASLDDFKRPWRDRHLYDRESGEGYYRNAFDYQRVADLLLEPMSGDGLVTLCAIDPLTQIDHAEEKLRAEENAILLVDGVFAFRPELDGFWDMRVWLETSAVVSFTRGLARDGDAVVLRDRYQVAEELYLSEVDPKSRAEVIIDNTDIALPKTVKS